MLDRPAAAFRSYHSFALSGIDLLADKRLCGSGSELDFDLENVAGFRQEDRDTLRTAQFLPWRRAKYCCYRKKTDLLSRRTTSATETPGRASLAQIKSDVRHIIGVSLNLIKVLSWRMVFMN